MKTAIERFLGKKFGKLTVLALAYRNQKGQTFWKCRCECRKEKVIRGDHLLDGATKSCGCNQQGMGNHRWNGCGEIGGWTWNNYRISAKRRNIPFKVSVKDMWELFLKQDRKCALSGESLHFSPKQEWGSKTNASLDRIDSSKGYVKGNVQWVTKNVNIAKQSMTQNEFIRVCELVTEHMGLSFNGRTVHSH